MSAVVRSSHAAWVALVAALVVLPMLFHSEPALSLLSQMGIMAVLCMSYNMLLGQGGMLSFGHSVFSGLGGYVAIHAMNQTAAHGVGLPVPFVPFIGAIGGGLFGTLFGFVATRRSGTTFAMITLGLVELVHAFSYMLPSFFGGEGGITTNRTHGMPVFGLDFGSQIQVYGLVAGWLLISTAAIAAFTQTPLGRMINAVRDNAERSEFIGFDPQRVRHLAMTAAGVFAGVAGGLAAVQFEIVGAETVGLAQSGQVLIFTYIGGIAHFFGPILGAVAGLLLTVVLPQWTEAWYFYLGLVFIGVVRYAPGGLAGSIETVVERLRNGGWRHSGLPIVATAAGGLLAGLGVVLLVETAYASAHDKQGALLAGWLPSGASPSMVALGGTVLAMTGLGALKALQAFHASIDQQRTLVET